MANAEERPGIEQEVDQDSLHPLYQKPDSDTVIMIRFAGNTAQVADARFRNCDPFQLKAAAWWLERHAEKSMTASEQRAAQMGVSGSDEGNKKGPSILTPGQLRS